MQEDEEEEDSGDDDYNDDMEQDLDGDRDDQDEDSDDSKDKDSDDDFRHRDEDDDRLDDDKPGMHCIIWVVIAIELQGYIVYMVNLWDDHLIQCFIGTNVDPILRPLHSVNFVSNLLINACSTKTFANMTWHSF